jgi:tetratricopeptide (TPR) repeat protein
VAGLSSWNLEAQSPEPAEPPLPQNPQNIPPLLEGPNPLLFFDPNQKPAPDALSTASEDTLPALPPLSPLLPGESPPPAPSPDLTPEQKALIALAQKVAGSVVSVRVWDEFGALLSAGVGFFISSDGLLLTDSSLLHPEIAERVDYITTTAADGTNHRVTGFYTCDLSSGVAMLQSDGPAPPPLQMKAGHDFSKPSACRVVALSETRGLLIADATVAFDDTLAGQGWLVLTGEDSPGAVGSPVITEQGEAIGIVAMKTPLKNWMNYALPIEMALYETGRKRPPLRSLKELPRTPRLTQVIQDPNFITAFNQIQSRSMAAATRTLLRLTKRYPRSAECWSLLGLSASYQGATPDALSCQRRAVALDPRAGLYWHQMAVAKVRARAADGSTPPDPAEEYEALLQAVEQNPNDRIGWLLLAGNHLKADNLQEAESSLRRLTFLAPTYAQGFYLLAHVQGKLGKPRDANEAITRCLQINDSNANAWFLKGLILDKMNEPKPATEAYQKTVRINPDHPNAWLNLARSLKAQNRPTEAAQAYQKHRQRLLKN